MNEIAVVVPVLGRPERVKPFLDSLLGSTSVPITPAFVCTLGDIDQLAAVTEDTRANVLIAGWPAGRGDYAKKVNLAYENTHEPWLFIGADDLCFCPEWAERALECAAATGAGVIGTQDEGNDRVRAGRHATHSLVARWYADAHGTINGSGSVLCELYDHNFVDDELVATAQSRGLFTFCPESIVEHLHPHWRKASWDATYEKGQRHFAEDRTLFHERRALWSR